MLRIENTPKAETRNDVPEMNDDFANWIGRQVIREDVATPRLAAEYRATMSPCLFEPDDGDHCPPGFHWGLAPATPVAGETGPDGAERKGSFLPPIPLPRRMWAGGMVETLRPIHVGQAVRRTSTISGIKFREGRAGKLCILSVTHEIAGDGGLLVSERQDLVFRDGAPKTSGEAALLPQPQGLSWAVDASPLLLFRFSAFTFNGHRIHYDADYAAKEGYPGLVVHGPLQAALMLNAASVRLGQVPSHFNYRCIASLFSGNSFTVSAEESDDSLKVRVSRHDGVTTAEAQAHVQGT